jgi:hypothetical protein
MGYFDSQGRFRQLGELAGDLSLAQLKNVEADTSDHNRLVQLSDGNVYRYHKGSALTPDDLLVIKAKGGGRFLLAPSVDFDLALPIGFALADAAVLMTLPAGCYLQLGRSYWEVTADWTGGSSSAIGASAGQAPHNTKGDILGGAAGDVAATLVASAVRALGTVGADVAAGILLKPTNTVRYDEITSAFTAGAGFVHLVGRCLANPGA